MRIDSHQHFWRLDRGDYDWMSPEIPALYRDYAPDDLAPLLRHHGVDRTILVQAAATGAETDFLLQLAQATPFVAGVVGWADFTAPDAANAIAGLAENRLLVGLRPMVQDIEDDDWLIRLDLAPAFRAMVRHGLVFDALVRPRHLSRLLVLADRHPDLAIVVDHAGKPQIRSARFEPWCADMTAIAARPKTMCKLSGLVTEAGPDWRVEDLVPYVKHLLAAFGPLRLLWGSDWPVVNLAGGYDKWREAALSLLGDLGEAERAAVLGGNAARVYLQGRGRP